MYSRIPARRSARYKGLVRHSMTSAHKPRAGERISNPPPTEHRTTRLLRRRILRWFERSNRPLPWRRDPTPYRVWISEIMLQQTRSQTVIPYYNRFIERYPDVAALARASEPDVLALWSGLGYYRRAQNILKAARQILQRHGGRFPADYKTILSLPGIGRYTAGAICSIAFDQPQPVVDGNIRRVISRLLGIRRRIPERFFWDRMAAWIPQEQASAFNQAMMELGAVLCLPSGPLCPQCPVRALCRARLGNLQHSIPPSKPRRNDCRIELVILAIGHKGSLLLVRQEGSYIPGEWALPHQQVPAGSSPSETAGTLGRRLCAGAGELEYLGDIRHSITHHRIRARVYAGEVAGTTLRRDLETGGMFWADPCAQKRMLTSSLFRKVLGRLQGRAD